MQQRQSTFRQTDSQINLTTTSTRRLQYSIKKIKQETIPVGCVPPACWSGEGFQHGTPFHRTPPSVDRQNTSENITFPQLRLRAVKTRTVRIEAQSMKDAGSHNSMHVYIPIPFHYNIQTYTSLSPLTAHTDCDGQQTQVILHKHCHIYGEFTLFVFTAHVEESSPFVYSG